jgi:hypothetical protein
MSARFMNCSSASTRVVYICIGAQLSAIETCKQIDYTYAQKTVEIDAARVECTVEVIHRVLNRTVLGDELNKSA